MKVSSRIWLKAGFSVVALGVGCSQGSGDSASPAADKYDLRTTITDADKLKSVYPSKNLMLNFEVSGKDKGNASLKFLRFECKNKDTANFSTCSGTPYTISNLKPGSSFSLATRAVYLDSQTGGEVTAKEATAETTVDPQATDTVPEGPAAPGAPLAASFALSSHLQIGGVFVVNVPESMHVTEYSTTKSSGYLSIFRIMADSDPNYVGNTTCEEKWDRRIVTMSAGGAPLTYCHSTPTRKAYSETIGFNHSMNYLEMVTDADKVSESNQEIISVGLSGNDGEWYESLSRFNELCFNSEIGSLEVPMVESFFRGINPEEVVFQYCDAFIPGAGGAPQLWKIGAFRHRDGSRASSQESSYVLARPNLGVSMEVTYAARPTGQTYLPEYFARQAQDRVLAAVQRLKL